MESMDDVKQEALLRILTPGEAQDEDLVRRTKGTVTYQATVLSLRMRATGRALLDLFRSGAGSRFG